MFVIWKSTSIVISVLGVIGLQSNSASKNAWIDLYETAFDNNFSSQGPFSMHKVIHGSIDRQDKLKKLVKRLAHHFCIRHNTKTAEFIEDGGGPVYTDAERLRYQIFTEHELVLCSHKQTADAKKLAAIETTKKLERRESFVGAVPAHHGENALSGLELDDCIKMGFAALGAQPKSKTRELLLRLQCMCYTPNIYILLIYILYL